VTATSVATGWWVYGVVRADADAATQEDGIESTHVRLIRAGRLAALAAEVPLDEFDEEGLRRNLEDLAWLEEQARAHDRVLFRALASAPLVPFRFGAVYRSEERVRQMLEQRASELEATLVRLRGSIELGVKAYLADARAETGEVSGGREYMLQKQRERERAADAEARAHDLALEVHGRLAALAVDARANPLQRPELSGRRERMLLNAAYLVEDERRDAFADAAAELRRAHAQDGLQLELTGPWPPYNFAEARE
jgi:gas vesicle protein GvpL/GvpF